MPVLFKQKNLTSLTPFLIALLLLFIFYCTLHLFHININDTPSMPMGLYRRMASATVHRGDIVSVCLPRPIARVGLQAGYLMKGACPSGAIAVLKKVIAVPHDTVRLTRQAIIVNGRAYFAPQQSQDDYGHAIKKWGPLGTYKNTHAYWLYGGNAPMKSWDSRYYGGVPVCAIQGVYKPLLTF